MVNPFHITIMTNKSTLKKVGVASFIMMASVFASRVIGVFREMTIAGIGGVQASVDAYQTAFIIPEILNHVVASGFLSITFIPIFSGYLSKNRPDEGYRVFSLILNTFGLILIGLIIVVMVWTDGLVHFFVPGIDNPATFALAVKMTRIIIPAQFFFFTGGLLMAVQFANEKFFIPALAPLIYNLLIIVCGLVLAPVLGMEGFAWGVLGGAFLGNFTLQIWGAKQIGLKYTPIFNLTHPDLLAYLKLTLPLMVGLTMTFSTEILSKYFGSYLSPGSIASLNYSLRVMFILVGLFGQAVGVASYPYMARLAANKEIAQLNEILNTTLKFIFLVLPLSTFFMATSHEIVLLLFQRGAFDSNATAMTAAILPFFMIGAFAFTAQNIVSRGFYAMQNTLFPTILSTVCVLVSLPAIYLLMSLLGTKGVALGLSISVILQSIVLYESWNKKSDNKEKNGVYKFFLKMIPVSLFIGIPTFFTATGLRDAMSAFSFWGALFIITIVGIEFLVLFYTAGIILKIQEIQTLFAQVSKRILLWKKKLNRSPKK